MPVVVQSHLPPRNSLGECVQIALDSKSYLGAPKGGLSGVHPEGRPDVLLPLQEAVRHLMCLWVTPDGDGPTVPPGKGLGVGPGVLLQGAGPALLFEKPIQMAMGVDVLHPANKTKGVLGWSKEPGQPGALRQPRAGPSVGGKGAGSEETPLFFVLPNFLHFNFNLFSLNFNLFCKDRKCKYIPIATCTKLLDLFLKKH